MQSYTIDNIEELLDKNVLFDGTDSIKVKGRIRTYITELTKRNHKVFLLDSYWSRERYHRFQQSRFRTEIERRYHIKMSVEDFLSEENIFRYMANKEINIIKVKSITGLMSAAELFPVILSKINKDIEGEKAHVLINDFILEQLSEESFLDLYTQINYGQIKFFIYNKRKDIIHSMTPIIDKVIQES